MTILEAIKTRHSIRKYTDEALPADVVDTLRREIDAINREADLHMQLVLDEPRAFRSLLAYGAFSGVKNYIMVVGRKSPSLDCRAGYCTERIVLEARRLGLDTCIAGLTYKKVKGAVQVGPDETIVVCIALGYAAEGGRKHKIKSPEQVSNISPASPDWFRRGVEAALLAPTAVNQQKFHFEFIAPSGVRPTAGRSLVGYTKVDLGIAMYNFEAAAGKDNFNWVDSPLHI